MDIKNFGQLISHLATKAGVQADNEHLKNLLSNAELTKVTIHGDLVKALDENLLSVDAATDNHPVIGPKYKAQALNAIDKKMEELYDQLGLDDASKTELKQVKSTYERFDKLWQKAKELQEKQNKEAGDPNKPDKSAALQKQIDELLGKLQAEKKKFEEELQKVQQEKVADKIAFERQAMYGNLKTIYDSLDPSIRATSLEAIINKALQDKDAEFAYDDAGKLIIRKKDGTNLVGANHTKYTPQSFIDEALAQNKILVTTDSPGSDNNQSQSGGSGQNPTTVIAKDGQISGINQSVAMHNLEAMKAFEQQS